MPYDGQALETGGLSSEADEVIRSFGMAPTPADLCAMAEEIERRLHIYPGGPVRACQLVRELQERAWNGAALIAWPNHDADLASAMNVVPEALSKRER